MYPLRRWLSNGCHTPRKVYNPEGPDGFLELLAREPVKTLAEITLSFSGDPSAYKDGTLSCV